MFYNIILFMCTLFIKGIRGKGRENCWWKFESIGMIRVSDLCFGKSKKTRPISPAAPKPLRSNTK
jgi:hypothetical protein